MEVGQAQHLSRQQRTFQFCLEAVQHGHAWPQYKVGFKEESFRTLMKNVAKDTFGHFMDDA